MKTLILLAAAALTLAGCATQPIPTARAVSADGFWQDEGVKGSPSLTINLTDQRAFFYKGKTLVGESRISSGRRSFETPPGRYKAIQKDADHVSNLYGRYVAADGTILNRDADVTKDPLPAGAKFVGAPMPYFVRFHGGYGFHAGMVPRYRASHGCVRLPRNMAARFFAATEVGMPITLKE